MKILTIRVVVKFGGADLSSNERINQATQLITSSSFKEAVVVVSAMGKMTDSLIQTEKSSWNQHYEVAISKATINVFIEENQLKRAQEAINNVV